MLENEEHKEADAETLTFDDEEQIYAETFDLNSVDPEVFECLPDEIKYELLSQHKENLKNKKSTSFEQFPQVRLLKKINVLLFWILI